MHSGVTSYLLSKYSDARRYFSLASELDDSHSNMYVSNGMKLVSGGQLEDMIPLEVIMETKYFTPPLEVLKPIVALES